MSQRMLSSKTSSPQHTTKVWRSSLTSCSTTLVTLARRTSANSLHATGQQIKVISMLVWFLTPKRTVEFFLITTLTFLEVSNITSVLLWWRIPMVKTTIRTTIGTTMATSTGTMTLVGGHRSQVTAWTSTPRTHTWLTTSWSAMALSLLWV